jgi:hypothetical protein
MSGANLTKPHTLYGWNQDLCAAKDTFSAKNTNLVDTQSIAFISNQAIVTANTEVPPFVNASFFEFPLSAPSKRVAACVQTSAVVGTSFLNTTLPIAQAGMAVVSQVAFLGKIPLNASNTQIADGEFHVVWPEGTSEVFIAGLDVDVSTASSVGNNTNVGPFDKSAVQLSRPSVIVNGVNTGSPVTVVDINLQSYVAGSTQVAIVAHFLVPDTSALLIAPSA